MRLSLPERSDGLSQSPIRLNINKSLPETTFTYGVPSGNAGKTRLTITPSAARRTGVLIDLFDAQGGLLAAGRESIDLRRQNAGEYLVRVSSATADGLAGANPAARSFTLDFRLPEPGSVRAIYDDFDRDIINGGDGNDVLIGGPDIDRISGGAGTDIFVADLFPAGTTLGSPPDDRKRGVELRDAIAADEKVILPASSESVATTKSGRLDREISIADPGLRAAIADALSIRTTETTIVSDNATKIEPRLAKPIMASDLAALTGLDASNRGIADLSGLEYATNLRWLDLSHNKLTSIAKLAPAVSPLRADANTPLGPRSLEYLSLDDNLIKSIEPLALLGSLRSLSADDNQIFDLKAVGNLLELRSLSLDRQTLAPAAQNGLPLDLTPLAGLRKLEALSIVSVGTAAAETYAKVVDLRPLSGLDSLKTLVLRGNAITSLDPLLGERVVDGGETSGPWIDQATGVGGGSQVLPPNTAGTATFTFADLAPGTYDLQATWQPLGFLKFQADWSHLDIERPNSPLSGTAEAVTIRSQIEW